MTAGQIVGGVLGLAFAMVLLGVLLTALWGWWARHVRIARDAKRRHNYDENGYPFDYDELGYAYYFGPERAYRIGPNLCIYTEDGRTFRFCRRDGTRVRRVPRHFK